MHATFYALFSDKQQCLMAVSTFASAGDMCVDVEHSLSAQHPGDQLWLVDSKEVAEKAALGPTKWYNAGYCSPNWDEKYFGALRVVEVEVEIKL